MSQQETKPCLNVLDVSIGHLFFYKDVFWIRTDRYSAYSPSYGACHFGDITDDEFMNIQIEAIKLDQNKIQELLRLNIKDITQ